MTPLAAILAAAALAPTGLWAGASPAVPSVSMELKGGTVVSASAWTNSYNCELGGPVGPAQVTVRPKARVSKGGTIRFESGSKTRRLRARLKLSRGRITGHIRIVGDMSGPCSSPALPVTLSRKR